MMKSLEMYTNNSSKIEKTSCFIYFSTQGSHHVFDGFFVGKERLDMVMEPFLDLNSSFLNPKL